MKSDDIAIDHDTSFATLFSDVVPLKSTNQKADILPIQHISLTHQPLPIRKQYEPDTAIRYIASDDLDALEAPSSYLKPDCDKNLLRKLRKGVYPIGDQIDLHGCNRFEAQVALSHFFAKTQVNCLLVIHGRGLTPNGRPILKTIARAWLTQQKFVLAFCEAQSSEGGEGAVLVLTKNCSGQCTYSNLL
ncbi:MAG: Smr/MutS family protein [Neisseriales bacterium]|nr:MAG: Smr/MutS family protein [Neisseriales bacterium]